MAERLLNKQDEGLFRKSTQLRAFTSENILKLVGHTSLPPLGGNSYIKRPGCLLEILKRIPKKCGIFFSSVRGTSSN